MSSNRMGSWLIERIASRTTARSAAHSFMVELTKTRRRSDGQRNHNEALHSSEVSTSLAASRADSRLQSLPGSHRDLYISSSLRYRSKALPSATTCVANSRDRKRCGISPPSAISCRDSIAWTISVSPPYEHSAQHSERTSNYLGLLRTRLQRACSICHGLTPFAASRGIRHRTDKLRRIRSSVTGK